MRVSARARACVRVCVCVCAVFQDGAGRHVQVHAVGGAAALHGHHDGVLRDFSVAGAARDVGDDTGGARAPVHAGLLPSHLCGELDDELCARLSRFRLFCVLLHGRRCATGWRVLVGWACATRMCTGSLWRAGQFSPMQESQFCTSSSSSFLVWTSPIIHIVPIVRATHAHARYCCCGLPMCGRCS